MPWITYKKPATLKQALGAVLPFSVRVELLRLVRLPRWLRERSTMARRKVTVEERSRFTCELAGHHSPLLRPGQAPGKLQHGKERNVAKASDLIDKVIIEPGQEFSYHHLVGRPSRLRGFRKGLELRRGQLGSGVGGGCCQISNMLYLLALRSGLDITERHRHAFDLFPDDSRSVPFGCGATVFYNYADLRFRNSFDMPVLISMEIRDNHLHGRVLAPTSPKFRVELIERDHRFFRQDGKWYRENHIHRQLIDTAGKIIRDEEVAHNCGQVMYALEPSPEQSIAETP